MLQMNIIIFEQIIFKLLLTCMPFILHLQYDNQI